MHFLVAVLIMASRWWFISRLISSWLDFNNKKAFGEHCFYVLCHSKIVHHLLHANADCFDYMLWERLIKIFTQKYKSCPFHSWLKFKKFRLIVLLMMFAIVNHNGIIFQVAFSCRNAWREMWMCYVFLALPFDVSLIMEYHGVFLCYCFPPCTCCAVYPVA